MHPKQKLLVCTCTCTSSHVPVPKLCLSCKHSCTYPISVPYLHMNTGCVITYTCTAPSHTNMLYQNSRTAPTRVNMLYMPHLSTCTIHQSCIKAVPLLPMHSEAITCTCTETVLAHSNTMYLIVLWPPVPILCAYIYCTYSSCTCTYQGHMGCLCLFTYKSVKRHHIPIRQSL